MSNSGKKCWVYFLKINGMVRHLINLFNLKVDIGNIYIIIFRAIGITICLQTKKHCFHNPHSYIISTSIFKWITGALKMLQMNFGHALDGKATTKCSNTSFKRNSMIIRFSGDYIYKKFDQNDVNPVIKWAKIYFLSKMNRFVSIWRFFSPKISQKCLIYNTNIIMNEQFLQRLYHVKHISSFRRSNSI